MKTRHNLPIMSVKELAAELGQPQTKLYRHVRQLEAVGLIKVASTRMVSGILEQRYQACQQDLTFGRGFLVEHVDESKAALQTALDLYRDGFFTAFRASRLPEGDVPAEESYRKPLLFLSDLKVSPAKAAELMTSGTAASSSRESDTTGSTPPKSTLEERDVAGVFRMGR
jgi:hypothetical protein